MGRRKISVGARNNLRWLGTQIRKYRKECGMTQQQVADALKVSRSAVSRWEYGKGNIKYDKVFSLSELFGVNFEVFVPPSYR